MRAFPLLLLALFFYNLLVFGGGLAGVGNMAALLNEGFAITMPSTEAWRFIWSDLFITASLCLLFLEMVKATRTGRDQLLSHAFSTLTFAGALIEFLLLKGFATSAFF